MNFNDLPSFIDFLSQNGHLKIITEPVSIDLEITEISRRFLANNGPALLFQNVIKADGSKSAIPVITNLYANVERIAFALGLKDSTELKNLGELLALLKHPKPPQSLQEAVSMLPLAKRILSMSPKIVKKAPSQQKIIKNPNLYELPIQKCWPKDIAPLITWGIVVTKDYKQEKIGNYNLGIYRLQLVSENKLIIRWLKMRGGASHYNKWQEGKSTMPIAIVIGADPATTMAAVMPLPENISEYNFAGMLANRKIELVQCVSIDLKVPANAEIIIEGEIHFEEYSPEGPFGDHTGYYNDVELFPVVHVKAITMRNNPIYLSTYTGKPPDEPAILGMAFNEVFIPIIREQFNEIVDFYLPPEGCSYRIAIVSIKKAYPGHAKRIMMGVWSYLKQFMYTKFVIIVDEEINIRDWKEVMWAISTRSDPHRDSVFIENTPIDYLDFASPSTGLGSKIGIDATNKIPPETTRTWGEEITMTEEIIAKIDKIWSSL